MPSKPMLDRHTERHGDAFRVVVTPAGDRLFGRVVHRQVQSVRLHGATLRAMRRALRIRYPLAELSRQRDVLISGRSVELWFAYREGRTEAVPPAWQWWNERGLAHVDVDPTGRLTRADARCRVLLDLSPGRSPRFLRDFVSPELQREICASAGDLTLRLGFSGAARLRLPSGRSLDVEFRARPEPARQRVHLSFRSFADRDSDNDWLAMDKSSLNSVPRATRRDLFRGGLRQKLAAGERLIGPLTGAPWAVLVTAGIVRLFVAMDGFEPTIVYGASGSMFGTYALIAPDPLLVGLQSVTPSVILNLSARRVEELVASSSKFAGAVSSDVRLQLQELVRAFAGRSATNLKQRLAREIMLLSDLQPEDRLVSVTEQQLADGVGSIRESIGRTIGDLRREGSIATTRHGLIVLDAVTLRLAGEVEIV